MAFGYAIDVVAEVEGEVGHVQRIIHAVELIEQFGRSAVEDAVNQLAGEFVVPGRYGGVRGEYAESSDSFNLLVAEYVVFVGASSLVEQLAYEQAGVTFIHVEAFDGVVSEFSEHAYSADSEHFFLA